MKNNQPEVSTAARREYVQPVLTEIGDLAVHTLAGPGAGVADITAVPATTTSS